jgi:hypothetical protein
MARIKKFGTNKPQKLSTFETFLVDDNPNSTYFRITEFKDTFTGGKNGFLIEGSEYLQETTDIKIEVLDVAGNPVYYEPGKGIPEYYEGISKVVSVYIYEDTPIGIGKITVLGELKNFLDTGDVVRPIPDEWKGVYNVKWEREFKINRLLSNEDKVRFRRRPKIDIDEITRPIFSATPLLVEQSGFVNGTPLVPIAGTRLAEFSLPTTYLLTITDNSNWSGSIVGSPIELPQLGVSLDSLDIITNKQLTVSTPYVVNGVVQPFFNQPYTASFNFLDTSIPIESALSGSFAKITITDLTTFVGDVARVKVFRKSQSEVSDFQFVQEIPLESNEILVDLESSQRAQEVYGLFTPSIINEYWVSSSNDLTVGFNQDFLFNSVRLDSIGVNRFFTQKELPINEGIEYSLDFNIRLDATVNSENFVSVFLEGERGGITVRQNIVTVQSSNPILQKSNITANFIGDEIQNPKLIFEVNGSGWHISNVSLRASQETAFSPDEISFIQPVPRTLESETFDFRFEFYDINNNYIPVLVEKTQTFSAGNLNRIAKRLELKPSSLYFQFDSGSGVGNPLPPTAIFIEAQKEFLTGSINFTSRSFDFDNNEISASEYIGGQYPGLLIDEGDDIYRLTVENFTGSREDIVVQYIQYVGEVEGVSDSVVITRVSDGKGGVNFEIRPYRGTVIRNKDELSTLEVQAVRVDGINEINLVSGLPLGKSDVKLFVQSGSEYITLTEASQSGFVKGLVAGTTGSGELDYNAVFNRDSIEGQLTLYLIPSSSQNREESIFSTLTLTDILDGLDAGFIEYDVDAFTINPRTETVFTPPFGEVTASYYRRGTFENPISASVLVYPSMSINEDFVPQYWLRYQSGSVNEDIFIRGFDEVGNELFSQLSSSFVGNPLEQNKQLTLSFNYVEPYTSESVFVEHTFSIIPEGLPGRDSINIELTPPVVVLSADENGTVENYASSVTEIKVKQGEEYLKFQQQRQAGTFFLTDDSITGINLDKGSIINQTDISVIISPIDNLTEEQGFVTYPLEIRPFLTSSFFTQSVSQSFTRVSEGSAARSVSLEASSNIVNYNGDGNVISPEGDIVLTATAFNTSGSVFFTFYKNGVDQSGIIFENSNIVNFFIGAGDAVFPGETATWKVEVRDGFSDLSLPPSSQTAITITGIQSAKESYNAQLSRENSSPFFDVFANLSFDNTSTEIIVTKGVNQLTASTSYPLPQFDSLGNPIPNSRYITTIASIPTYISASDASGNRLFSGSIVPPVNGVATTGNLLGWDGAIDVNERPQSSSAEIVYKIDVEDGKAVFFKTQSFAIQYEGNIGPGIVMRGEWTGSLDYIFDVPNKRRDAVFREINGDVHYWATTATLVKLQSPPPFTNEPFYDVSIEVGDVDDNGWQYLGIEDLFVAAKIAIFEESFVKNTINVGNNPGSEFANIVIAGGRVDPYIAVGQNGTVGPSGDQTTQGVIGYDSPGIFMGTFDSSGNKTPRFSLVTSGSGLGRSFLWNGETLAINAGNLQLTEAGNLTVTGTINANAGNFTNTVNVGSGSITGSLLVGTDTTKITITGTNDPSSSKIFAGVGIWNNTDTGFYMDASGRFSLKNALNWDGNTLNISGNINITGGDTFNELQNLSSSLQEVSASAGESIVDDTGRIKLPATPTTGSGLHLGSNFMGYFANEEWKTYMASNGNFFLEGDDGGLSWNSATSKLEISGSINAFDGNIGNWIISNGKIESTQGRIILDSEQQGMFIQDDNGDTKLSIRTGVLQTVGSGTVTNTPTAINHSVLSYTTNQNFTQTFTTTSFSANLIAGAYSFSIDATSISGNILNDPGTAGFFNISYSYQILNSANQLISTINLAAGTSFGDGGNVQGQNVVSTINISTTGAYTIRPIFTVIAGFTSPGRVDFPSQDFTPSPATIIFSPLTNFAELTDEGLQVVSSTDSFVQLKRGAFYPLEVRGQSLFKRAGTGASGDAIRVRGNVTPFVDISGDEANLGGIGVRWNGLHVDNIFANGVMNMAGATGFRITIPNTATDIGGRGRANAWTTYSDRRIKDNITSIETGLNVICNLNPVKYRQYSSEYDEIGNLKLIKNEFFDTVGFIAQEVNDILPEVVSVGDETMLWGINDEKITPYLVKAIQELSKKVTDLELIISGSNNL